MSETIAETKAGFLIRLPTFFFVVFCLMCGILGLLSLGGILIVVISFILYASDVGPEQYGPFAEIVVGLALLVGFVVPIILLSLARKRPIAMATQKVEPIFKTVEPITAPNNIENSSEFDFVSAPKSQREIKRHDSFSEDTNTFRASEPFFATAKEQSSPPNFTMESPANEDGGKTSTEENLEKIWYYVEEGEEKGPVSATEISVLYSAHKIERHTYVWRKGFKAWVRFHETELVHVPPPLPTIRDGPPPVPSDDPSFSAGDVFRVILTIGFWIFIFIWFVYVPLVVYGAKTLGQFLQIDFFGFVVLIPVLALILRIGGIFWLVGGLNKVFDAADRVNPKK
jgi:hypothetical protein